MQHLRATATRQRFRGYIGIPMEQKWNHLNAALATLHRSSVGNNIHIYYDTGDSFRAMFEAVDNAKRSIRWQTYICKDDDVGKATIRRLIEATKRGVEVELLYDCGGNISGRSALLEPLREAGGRVIVFRPFWRGMWNYFANGMHWHMSPAIRNHRKILVVDDEIAFTGGLNIGNDYCAKWMGGNGRFRDTHCRVTGPAVRDLLDAYQDTVVSAAESSPTQRGQLFPPFRRWRHWAGTMLHFQTAVVETSPTRALLTARFAEKRAQLKAAASAAMTSARAGTGMSLSLPAGITAASITEGERPKPIAPAAAIKARAKLRLFLNTRKPPPVASAAATAIGRKFRWIQRTVATKGSMLALRFEAARHGAVLAPAAPSSSPAAIIAPQQALSGAAGGVSVLQPASEANQTQGPSATEPAVIEAASPPLIAEHEFGTEITSCHAQVLMCNPHTRDWSIQLAFWLVVRKADHRVWVSTPYLMPHRKLLRAVVSAANRGVDVRIIVGSETTCDPKWMWYATQYVTHRLVRAGVKIYYFDGAVMHAKTVVVDSVWSSVGSYNWDILSNKLLEACVTSYDLRVAAEMEHQFEQDMRRSKQVEANQFERRNIFLRLASSISYFMLKLMETCSFWNYSDPDLTSRVD